MYGRNEMIPSRYADYENAITVAVVNFSAIWGDKIANLKKMKGFIREAVKKGANLILFPELALTGYEPDGSMHESLAETIPGPTTKELFRLASANDIYIVFGMPEKDKERLYNSAAVVGPEGIVGAYRKVHPWIPEVSWCTKGSEYPVFITRFGPIGISICYDTVFFPEESRIYALKGVRLLLSPTAMSDIEGWGMYEFTVQQVAARATDNLFFLAFANLVGKEKNISFVGGSLITGPNYPAIVHTYAGPASRTGEELLIAKLEFAKMHEMRNAIPLFNDRRPETYDSILKSNLDH